MIPHAYVIEWRRRAPWPSDEQVEQDLILSRVLVELYDDPAIRSALAVRGGAALAKLHMDPGLRYSEDIDFVQLRREPIGATLNAIRAVLDPWLGTPVWKRSHASVKLVYRVSLGRDSTTRRRVKLEINTREHGSVFGLIPRTLAIDSRWFAGTSEVTTYQLDELLATKLRALYQRKKGRDLFDLAVGCKIAEVDPKRVVEGFTRYLDREGLRITRVEFEANLAAKMTDRDFLADVRSLVSEGTEFDAEEAAQQVREGFIARIP